MMEVFILIPCDSILCADINVGINVNVKAFLIILIGLNASTAIVLSNAHIHATITFIIRHYSLMNRFSCLMIAINSYDGLEIR